MATRRTAIVVASLLVVVAAASATAVPIEPVPFLEMGADQWFPAANDSYFVYSSNSALDRDRYHAIARDRVTDAERTLNASGTDGFVGNIEPGANVVVMQQVRRSNSDIFLYDLGTDIRVRAPDVNTGRWEWDPKISTKFISFVRNRERPGEDRYVLMLYNRLTGATREIIRYGRDELSFQNGGVGERYITWSICNSVSCYVFIRDLTNRVVVTVPSPRWRPQYDPALDEANGYLYYSRSGHGCGASVGIWRRSLADIEAPPEKVASLPNGREALNLTVAPNPVSGMDDVLFTSFECGRHARTDIWSVPGVS